ncbi:MAG: adenylate kinase [Acidimicrobiaceae bacterium]|nr:adenylate kinase [Acidimicrobiaceae bacterium]
MTRGARLVVLGKQGAGKGTQCVRLSHYLAVPHISTGDMLRAAVKAGTEFGQLAKAYMDRGELIPDDVILGIVEDRLAEPDATRGFLLDGFPRTTVQAKALDEMVGPKAIDLALDLEVPTELVLQRLSSRRVCSTCGANYSLEVPPKLNWTCDLCGGEVVQRPDDTESAIRRRLDLYEESTAPLLEFYSDRNLLSVVDGVGTPDEVMERLVEVVDRARTSAG